MSINVQPREKIYYNINITGKSTKGSFTSDASFNVYLNQSLLDDVSKYQFLVEKFKIDTESIPLFYVDIQNPQPPVSNNLNFITNYTIYTFDNFGNLCSVPVLYSNPTNKPARVVKIDPSGNVYYDKQDECFAIYSYDVFISCINDALNQLFNDAQLTLRQPSFFQYDHTLEKVCLYTYLPPSSLILKGLQIYFSMNLHPFIGEAFNTIWYETGVPGIDDDVYSINIEADIRLQDIVSIDGNNYIKMIQEYQAMSSWASINRILIVSQKLPIKREYYPISNTNGIITETLTSYENLVSMNIICSYLFPSTTPSDYRTNITYSSPTIDTADLIEMTNSGPLRELDIQALWSDKNGNIYPIQLGYNKQVNLRLCFVRK